MTGETDSWQKNNKKGIRTEAVLRPGFCVLKRLCRLICRDYGVSFLRRRGADPGQTETTNNARASVPEIPRGTSYLAATSYSYGTMEIPGLYL